MDVSWVSLDRLSMEPYDGPITTIVWLKIRSETNGQTDNGKALNSVLLQISKEPSWDHTLLATPYPASYERIAFIGKDSPLCDSTSFVLHSLTMRALRSLEDKESASFVRFKSCSLHAITFRTNSTFPY